MRRVISLNDSNWKVGAVAQKPFGDVNDLAAVAEWLEAKVPGDVRLDLLRAGKIADPFFAANNEDSQWVDARDWWYLRHLELDLAPDEHAWLVFEGIDYQSAVFLNGHPLGRHTGMFSRQVYEIIPPYGRTGGSPLTIAVRVWGSDALPRLRLTRLERIWKRLVAPLFTYPNEPYPDRYATVKCQMQFGWDFAPRLRTFGIWDDVNVVVARSVWIEDIWIKPEVLDLPAKAQTTVALTLHSDRDQTVRVDLRVHGSNFAVEPQTYTFDLPVTRGRQTRKLTLELREPRLWYPWDLGEPNLYQAEADIISSESQVLDSCTATFGIRSFELAHTTGAPSNAEPWAFLINGERAFLRGVNWAPLDAIPGRLTREDYAARLRQAREANVNFLRVWGGGLKEKQAFYDLCDELGLLVWQEFPFAGAVLDRFPRDPAFLDLVRDEAAAIVRALRNHPSLVVWCGGNEFSTAGNEHIVTTIDAAVQHEDGTRPFKPASPFRDESHNWVVWHRQANLRDYRSDKTPFLSEFGLQALPERKSLEQFLPSEALQSPHALWEYHRAQLGKLERYARSVNPRLDTIDDWIDATQRAQAFALQIGIEHVRRRKGRTAGVAVWQFDDPWPAISWSIVDYYGRPKRAFHALKQLYAPVLASFDYPLVKRRPGDIVHGDLWVVNDLHRDVPVRVRAMLNDREIYARSAPLVSDSVARLEPLDVWLDEGENELRLELSEWGQVLSTNTYDLNFCDTGEISPLVVLGYALYDRLMR